MRYETQFPTLHNFAIYCLAVGPFSRNNRQSKLLRTLAPTWGLFMSSSGGIALCHRCYIALVITAARNMHTRSQYSYNVCTGRHVLQHRRDRREEDSVERDRGLTSWTYIFCNLRLEWSTRRALRKTQLHHKGSLMLHMRARYTMHIIYKNYRYLEMYSSKKAEWLILLRLIKWPKKIRTFIYISLKPCF